MREREKHLLALRRAGAKACRRSILRVGAFNGEANASGEEKHEGEGKDRR